MKKTVVVAMLATLLGGTAMAQSVTVDASKLDAILSELQDLKSRNERLEAEVEYLKANAKEERKQLANDEVTLSTLNATAAVAASRYTWTGDFRYRHENINAEENATTRNRERIRLRVGFQARVNDTLNMKLQLATTNGGNDSYRSANQTLGAGWDRKTISIDQAYAEWKPLPVATVVFGKQAIPWATTASYFFDKDLTPEGIAAKYVRGPWFANASYMTVTERDVAASSLASKDADLYAVQLGWKRAVGGVTWTAAAGYFALNGIRDRIVSGVVPAGAPTGTSCAIDGAFGSGQGTGNNAFGNSTYNGAAPQVGSSAFCTRLLNDYHLYEGLLQADWVAGKYPISVFVDYLRNNGIAGSVTGNPQDTGIAAGFQFNKAGAAKTWEFGVVYQKVEKDGDWTGFHDSDFGGGNSDTNGYVFKYAYVPAANWTLNGTYFLNDRFIDPNDASATRRYKRYQLDLNYKF